MKTYVRKLRYFFSRLWRFFNTTVLGGIVVILPLYLLFVVVRFLIKMMTKMVKPISKILNYAEGGHEEWLLNLISLTAVLTLFFFIGLFVRTNFGQQIFHFVENKWLRQLPFYGSLRDTVQAFFGNKKMPFQEVVLVDLFDNGTTMTGFVSEKHDNGIVTVFVPTGPNPTNGFIFHVKEDRLEYVDVKAEEAMRTIIGVGVGSSIIFGAISKKNVSR